MTALRPLENLRVRAVASERYPLNKYCASPVSEPGTLADDPHHIFPRSLIGGDSWFVEIELDGSSHWVIPHVIGLSREQHERIERHEAWIKLEDGIFNWYERVEAYNGGLPGDGPVLDWELVGPLDPQPGYAGGVKKRKRKTGEARRKRRTISLRVPDDTENGGEIWDETLERVRERLVALELYDESDTIPVYEALIAALTDWCNSDFYAAQYRQQR